MNEHLLREEGERRLFQEFRIRLATKRDETGNVKHAIIGKVIEVRIEQAAISNVERIRKAM